MEGDDNIKIGPVEITHVRGRSDRSQSYVLKEF